jgi:hypothetical protein
MHLFQKHNGNAQNGTKMFMSFKHVIEKMKLVTQKMKKLVGVQKKT